MSYFHPLSTTVTQNATISSSSSSDCSVIILITITTTTSFSPTSSSRRSSATGAQTGSGNTNQRTTLWSVHAVALSWPASVVTSLTRGCSQLGRIQRVVLFQLTINLLCVLRHATGHNAGLRSMTTVWASYKVLTANTLLLSCWTAARRRPNCGWGVRETQR